MLMRMVPLQTLERQFSTQSGQQRPYAFRRALDRVSLHGSSRSRLAQEVCRESP